MLANELRIGNVINWTAWEHDGNGFINKEIVLTDSLFVRALSKGFLAQIIGIPLTEEWLLKFGFENKKYKSDSFPMITKLIGQKRLRISHSPFEKFKIEYRGVILTYNLKHVHQLQNLYFALTGEELNIKP